MAEQATRHKNAADSKQGWHVRHSAWCLFNDQNNICIILPVLIERSLLLWDKCMHVCVSILESVWFRSWQDTEHSAPPYQPGTNRSQSPRGKTAPRVCENVFERGTPPMLWSSLFFSSVADSTTLHKSFVYFYLFFSPKHSFMFEVFKTSSFQTST